MSIRETVRLDQSSAVTRSAWWQQGYSAAEIEVLIGEGFTLEQPPTYKERLAVQAIAHRAEIARVSRRAS